jgi:hypothetical protein
MPEQLDSKEHYPHALQFSLSSWRWRAEQYISDTFWETATFGDTSYIDQVAIPNYFAHTVSRTFDNLYNIKCTTSDDVQTANDWVSLEEYFKSNLKVNNYLVNIINLGMVRQFKKQT